MLALCQVQKRHHRAGLTPFRVLCHDPLDLRLVLLGKGEALRLVLGNTGGDAHLSISPKTISSDPMIATESASM